MFFFTYLSIYLFIKLFNDFFIHLLIFYIYTLCKRGIQLFIFMQLFTCKFIHLFDYLFISSKIVSMYKKLFVDSFIILFKHLNINSFINSLNYQSIYTYNFELSCFQEKSFVRNAFVRTAVRASKYFTPKAEKKNIITSLYSIK